ncbi:MAG: AI-2E family transporter [Alphaproteobacteria bacterium]|nr:AI-2E family transporter [Alphaproteobacteria bacterium]
MTVTNHLRFWFITFAVFAALVWLLSPILLPFVAGFAIAYFLDPIVGRLTVNKVPRWLATMLVLLVFILILVLAFLLLLPVVQGQIIALVNAIPGYAKQIEQDVRPWIEGVLAHISPEDMERLRTAAGQYAGEAVNWLGRVMKNLLTGGMAIFDILTLIVITPVVAFYLLRDWPKLTGTIDKILPRQHYDIIRAELNQIDGMLAGFLRGQAMVCLALGSIYAIGLSIVGLQFGAVIGITAGVLSFIPYVGTTFGWIISLILALMQFDTWQPVAMVLGVFVVGQALEGYFLTPKLVGDRVGLHPVWILFAIFAGGSLLGFLGVLIAVPVAAVIGVLIRFAVRQYKDSEFYKT